MTPDFLDLTVQVVTGFWPALLGLGVGLLGSAINAGPANTRAQLASTAALRRQQFTERNIDRALQRGYGDLDRILGARQGYNRGVLDYTAGQQMAQDQWLQPQLAEHIQRVSHHNLGNLQGRLGDLYGQAGNRNLLNAGTGLVAQNEPLLSQELAMARDPSIQGRLFSQASPGNPNFNIDPALQNRLLDRSTDPGFSGPQGIREVRGSGGVQSPLQRSPLAQAVSPTLDPSLNRELAIRRDPNLARELTFEDDLSDSARSSLAEVSAFGNRARATALEQQARAFTGGSAALDATLASRGIGRGSGVAGAALADLARAGAEGRSQFERDLANQQSAQAIQIGQFDAQNRLQRAGLTLQDRLGRAGLQQQENLGVAGLQLQDRLGRAGLRLQGQDLQLRDALGHAGLRLQENLGMGDLQLRDRLGRAGLRLQGAQTLQQGQALRDQGILNQATLARNAAMDPINAYLNLYQGTALQPATLIGARANPYLQLSGQQAGLAQGAYGLIGSALGSNTANQQLVNREAELAADSAGATDAGVWSHLSQLAQLFGGLL